LVGVSIGSLPLVHQVEQVSLVARTSRVCSTYSLVADTTRLGSKAAASISLASWVLVLSMATGLSAVPVLASIALTKLCHEVAIEHCLPHLRCLLSLRQLVILAARVETTHASLVEHLLLIELVHIGQHLMDSRVIGRLEHNPCLGGVHLVYAQRSVAISLAATSLLSHAVCHEEGLIGLLGTETTTKRLEKGK
jgi:hypothetical protein